mgnify:FL=1
MWRRSTKSGTVYSATTVMRAPSEAFKNNTPYVIVLVELDEGFRIMANITNAEDATVKIGDPIRIIFEPLSGQIALPQAELTHEPT